MICVHDMPTRGLLYIKVPRHIGHGRKVQPEYSDKSDTLDFGSGKSQDFRSPLSWVCADVILLMDLCVADKRFH